MKYSLMLITSLLSYTTHAQLSYVDIDWEIDQTLIMQNGQTDVMEFDIDGDGSQDLRITSWSNHTAGIETVIETLLLSPSLHEGLETQNCNMLRSCTGGFGSPSIEGYLYSSDCSNPSNTYLKYPFSFDGSQGIHCGFLYVRYEGTLVTIEGYAWNETAGQVCSCSSSGWLSLEDPVTTESLEVSTYYNLMGQAIRDPHGLVLKVYESGRTEKVYVP